MTQEEKVQLIGEQQSAILNAESRLKESEGKVLDLLLRKAIGEDVMMQLKEVYDERKVWYEAIAKCEASVATLRAEDADETTDGMGKVEQSLEGKGTAFDPYKGWKVGMSVEAGSWYETESGYLWEAIKTGTPKSETDREYFDVVGY